MIGSGATAVTIVPNMAADAEHVTLLQRSPTYMVSRPSIDPLAAWLKGRLPDRFVFWFMRWWNALLMVLSFNLIRKFPDRARAVFRKWGIADLPAGYDYDRHFKPTYAPWDQRVCLIPDSDLFKAIRDESVSMVTDSIETFTENGIKLASGEELEADIIVTATGLNLLMFGGADVVVDGEEIVPSELVTYKGMMFSGVPNLAMTFGYTNASWTLKADLVSEYFCRLINYVEANGKKQWMPKAPPASVGREDFIDLKSGYVLRVLDELPKQGAKTPWKLRQNYPLDVLHLRRGKVEDEGIEFSRPPAAPADEPAKVAAGV